MSANDYIHTLNTPTGYGWIAMLGKGDYLNFIGIAILVGLTTSCYLVILPIFIRKKDTPYTVIIIVEIAILVLAASGILKDGGH